MSDNLSIGEKIKQFRKAKGLSVLEFAEMYDLKKDNLYKWEKGTKPQDAEDYLKLEGILKLEIIPRKPIVNEQQREPYHLKRRNQKSRGNSPFSVPLIPVKAQSGYVKAIDQETYIDTLEKYALPPGVNPQGAIWRYWEVEGDSNEPTFRNGDIILTSQVHQMDWENMRNFYFYVIVTTEKVLLKRIFCKNKLEWVLISDNEDGGYAQQILPVEYIKEVWVYRRGIVDRAPPTKKFKITV